MSPSHPQREGSWPRENPSIGGGQQRDLSVTWKIVTNGADLAGQRDEILRACRKAGSADELFARVAEPLRRAVPFEGSAWFGMDPAMLLPTAPARIENVAPGHCESFWQREFLVEDTNLFQSLARDSKPAAALLDATQNRPARSARYRSSCNRRATATSCAPCFGPVPRCGARSACSAISTRLRSPLRRPRSWPASRRRWPSSSRSASSLKARRGALSLAALAC